jgi:hypothetical protein
MENPTLFEDEFIAINHQIKDKMMHVEWKEKSEKLSDEHFRKINELYIKFSEENEINGFLINAQDFLFPISNATQEWVGSEILPKLKEKGIEKVAFVLSKEFIAQLSIELTMQENPLLLNIGYFDNEGQAKNWLVNPFSNSEKSINFI